MSVHQSSAREEYERRVENLKFLGQQLEIALIAQRELSKS